MANSIHAVQAVLNEFAIYLLAEIPELGVLKEWPNANQTLNYPMVSLVSGKAQLMNRPLEQIALTEPDEDGKVTATYVVGQYDYKLQADIWAGNKAERDVYLGKFLDAVNKEAMDSTGKDNPMGLSLKLPSYFDIIARLDVDSHEYQDDMQAAQRQERRVRVDILVNVRAIKQRTLYAMKNVEINLGVNQNGEDFEADDIGTEQVVITSAP